MATRFKAIQRSNPLDKEAEKLHYATIIRTGMVDIESMTRRISTFCSLSEPDIRAVVAALRMDIQESLLDGKTVKVDGLGTFSLSLRSAGCATAEEVCSNTIKGAKLNFRVGRELRDTISRIKFEKQGHANDQQTTTN